MKKVNRRKSIMLRMILPYVLMILLVLIIIYGYFLPSMLSQNIEKTLETQLSNIRMFAAGVDQHIATLIASCVEIARNDRMTPYAITKSDLGGYYAIREMRKTMASNRFVLASFYYLKATGRFYTSEVSYTLAWMGDKYDGYRYDNWNTQSISNTLKGIMTTQVRAEEWAIIPIDNRRQVITLMLPIPMDSGNPYGVLVVLIDRGALLNLMEGNEAGDVHIYDRTGERIFSLNQEYQLNDDTYRQSEGIEQIFLNGVNYARVSAEGIVGKWLFVRYIPMSEFAPQYRALLIGVSSIAVFMTIAGGALMYLAFRSNYRPLRKLSSFAGKTLGNVEHGQQNEYELIQAALEGLSERNQSLDEDLQEILPAARETILHELLSGQYSTIADFNIAAQGLGVQFSLSLLFVAAVNAPEDDITEFAKQENMHGNGWWLRGFNMNELLFVGEFPSQDEAMRYFEYAYKALSDTSGEIYIALGSATDDPLRFSRSYAQATETLNRMLLMGTSGVQVYQVGSNENALIPFEWLYTLKYALSKADEAQATIAVERLIAFLASEQMSVSLVVSVFADLRRTLLLAMEEYAPKTVFLPQWNLPAGDLRFSQMREQAKTLTCLLQDALTLANSRESAMSVDDVRAYIAENCVRYDFSIQEVAERFGMSYSGFSHYFRRQTGSNCKQYVDAVRIDRAIERITGSRDSLEQIAVAVGFANASSLIRVFRKVTGKTPGSYRVQSSDNS